MLTNTSGERNVNGSVAIGHLTAHAKIHACYFFLSL